MDNLPELQRPRPILTGDRVKVLNNLDMRQRHLADRYGYVQEFRNNQYGDVECCVEFNDFVAWVPYQFLKRAV